MNKGRFKNFLLKIKSFFSRYSIIVGSAIIIPTLLYSVRYFFADEYYYNNLYFDGEQLNIEPSTFKVTKIKPLTKIMNISSYNNYQGGSCYQNYYAIAGNNFECLLIYDMATYKVEHAIFTNQINNTFHCNTIFFGSDFYSSYDKFPVLYMSQETSSVPMTIACRIVEKGGVDSIEVVQTIELALDEKDKIYYPNSYYDHDYGLLYYGGYTKKSYMRSDDNFLKFYCFRMPDLRVKYAELTSDDILDSFTIPSETATQGGFVSHGYLYQSYAGLSEAVAPFTKPTEYPKLMIIDLNKGEVVYKVEDLRIYGEGTAANEEFENIAVSSDGRIFASGNTHFKIYQFEFEAQLIILDEEETWE